MSSIEKICETACSGIRKLSQTNLQYEEQQ